MDVTARRLNRATLARQLLLEREPLKVVDAVRRVVALQAQEAPSPYVALWSRVADFDPADLDAAFARQKVVKASLMRSTLHAVAAADYPTFHQAVLSTLRAARLNDRRFSRTGLSVEDADALVPHLLAHASAPRTKDQIEELLAGHVGDLPEPGVWWALRTFAPLIHAPTGGPWSFGLRPSYLAAPDGGRPEPEVAVQQLLWRYLEAFGPASAKDFAQFALLRQTTIRPALDAIAHRLATLEGPDGTVLYDVPDALLPDEDTPAPPRLLAMWDSILLAYADRSRLIPPEYRPLVIRRNGDVLPTLLVDGHVCGVWLPVDAGIEARAFHRLPDDAWDGLEVEARSLVGLLGDRHPAIYRRYARWWSDLPAAETHVLAD